VLVAVKKAKRGFEYTPVDISSNTGPTYILGQTGRDQWATLDWLRDPKNTVFFFPSNAIGPDLLLLLMLSDGRLLRLLVQFKQITANTCGPVATADAFRTTDPSAFVSQRTDEPEGSPNRARMSNISILNTDHSTAVFRRK
jgi:hypothetical protein